MGGAEHLFGTPGWWVPASVERLCTMGAFQGTTYMSLRGLDRLMCCSGSAQSPQVRPLSEVPE